MSIISSVLHLVNGVDIDSLLKDINSLKTSLTSANKKIIGLNNSLSEKKKEIEKIKEKNQVLSEDLVREHNNYLLLEDRIEGLNKTINELQSQNESLKKSETRYKDSNVTLKDNNLSLTNQVNNLEEKCASIEPLKTLLSKKDTELAKIQSDYNVLQLKDEEIRKTLEDTKSSLEREKEDKKVIEGKCADFDKKLVSLTKEKENLIKENSTANEELDRSKEKLAALLEEKKQFEDEKSLFETERKKLQETLLIEKQHVNEKDSELQSQKTENESLRKQIDSLISEKEELSPYMYLIEAKKEEEAKELAIKQSKDELSELINTATTILLGLKHDEVKSALEESINISKTLADSVSSLEEINDSISSLQSAIAYAKEQENLLFEQEEEAERKRKEQEEIEELKNSLNNLIQSAESFYDTITYNDIAVNLRIVIDDSEQFLNNGIFERQEIETKHKNLESAINNAKEEIIRAKKTESHIVKRSILEIFDTKEGDIIESESFFKRPEHELIRWRRIFEESILTGEHRFICTNCRQDVKISGRKYERGQVAFFSHLHDSDYCEIKTTTGLSKEQIEARKYGLVAESDRHKRLKKLIHNALDGYASRRKGVTDVVEEKRVNSNLPYMNWRKPDVMARYNNLNIVFELQLSTTFISVVVQRDIFYRLNDYFIIWVFNFDDNQKYVDLTNLMCKDIYYANKRNVFIFDIEAQQASEEREELVLKCNWLDTDNTWHYSPTKGNGNGILITLDELNYDTETAKPYYFDAETPYYEIHPEVKERILKEERSKQQMIEDLQARASREAEEAIVKRDYALKLMLENDGHVSPFKDGNKYGFKYNNVVLVPAKYSSYSEFGNNGMYKVSFNRHHGLVDKYGNELFACDYLDFHRLSNGLIVAESTSGFYISGIGRISERSPHDTISLRELTPELFVVLHNSNRLNVFIIDDEFLFLKKIHHYAFYSISGEQVIETTFSNYHFTQGYSALWLQNSLNMKWKVVELDGTDKNDLEYTNCNFEEERTIAIEPGNTDVYNSKGEILWSTEYDNIISLGLKEFSKVIKGELCGLVDGDFLERLSVEYEEILSHKNFIYAKKGGLWAILDDNCSFLSAFEFDTITDFYSYSSSWSNWILVKRNNLEGLYNSDGHCVLKAEYESIKTDKEFLIVKRNGKFGLYNKDGKALLETKYDDIKSFRNNVNFIARAGEEWYIYNIVDNIVNITPYESVSQFDDDYLLVQTAELFGLSSTRGEICLPIRFNKIERFKTYSSGGYNYNTSVFKCKLKDKYGAYSIKENKYIVAAEFDDIEWWHENKYQVKKGSKWGLYEIGKGLFTEIKYSSISSFNNTRITVSISDNYLTREGHITPDGKEIISDSKALPGGYTTKEFFSKWALFKDSEKILPYEHDYPIEILENNLFKIRVGDKYGIKDSTNHFIFQPQYRDVVTKENAPFVIVKLIKYRKERRSKSYRTYNYKWRTTYHTVDVEYNEYQLYKIDGTQNGIPSEYCGTYSNMEFINSKFVWIDRHIFSLDKFVITEDTYTSFDSFDYDGFIRVRKDKFGLLNSNLKLILPCNFDSIKPWGNNLLLTRKDIREGYWSDYSTKEEYQLYKKDGTACSAGIFDAYEDVGEGRLKIYKHPETGFVTLDGEIIPDSEETINNEIIVSKAFGHIEIRNTDGEILAPLSDGLTDVKPLTEAFYIIVKDSKQGVLKVNGKTCIKCEYDSIELWSEGIVLVSKNLYYSGISTSFYLLSFNGDNISTKAYTKISSIENGFADAERDGITGKLNNRGVEVYDLEEPLNDSMIKRRCFGKWEVVNQNKQQVLPCQYDDVVLFEGSMLLTSEIKQIPSQISYIAPNNSTIHTLTFQNGERVLPFEFTTIKKCSNGSYIVTKDSKDALYDHTFNTLVPFEKSYITIREWSENKYVAQTNSLSYGSLITNFIIINEKGETVSKNSYSKIGDLIDGRAEVTFQYRVGYINEKCEELVDIIESNGEWTISKCMGLFSIEKNGEQVLSNLIEAKFFSNTVISFRKNKKTYSLYSIIQEKELPAEYRQIGELDGKFAPVVNLYNVKGAIDEEGNECYDHEIELGDTLLAKRKFSKYEVFNDGKIILKDITDVSKWDEGKLKVTISPNKVQIFSINENKYLGDCYNFISDLEEGKAKVKKNASEGYIDANVNVVPSEDIVITSNLHKIKRFDYWYIVDDNYNPVINDEFREIGSYKGKFVKFDGVNYRILDDESKNVVPVYGTYYKTFPATLIYLVGGHYVRVKKKFLELNDKSISEFIKENKTLKLMINSINTKKQAVYARPYKEPTEKAVYPPYEIGQIIEGKISKIVKYGIFIETKDERKTMIHISQLQKLGYGDYSFVVSQPITIKKSGFDEEHNKDIWDIISLEGVVD